MTELVGQSGQLVCPYPSSWNGPVYCILAIGEISECKKYSKMAGIGARRGGFCNILALVKRSASGYVVGRYHLTGHRFITLTPAPWFLPGTRLFSTATTSREWKVEDYAWRQIEGKEDWWYRFQNDEAGNWVAQCDLLPFVKMALTPEVRFHLSSDDDDGDNTIDEDDLNDDGGESDEAEKISARDEGEESDTTEAREATEDNDTDSALDKCKDKSDPVGNAKHIEDESESESDSD
jgi:hypothetical protein